MDWEKYEIEYVVLFGSVAAGRATKESDIDFAVKFKTNDKKKIEKLLKEMILELPENADILVLNFAKPSVKYEALTKGKLIWGDREKYWEDGIKAVKWFEDWRWMARHYEEREVEKVKG